MVYTIDLESIGVISMRVRVSPFAPKEKNMADFCKQCSIELFGEDYGNFKGLTLEKDWKDNKACIVLCEGCGYIQVDPEGNCVSKDCLKKHGEIK